MHRLIALRAQIIVASDLHVAIPQIRQPACDIRPPLAPPQVIAAPRSKALDLHSEVTPARASIATQYFATKRRRSPTIVGW